MSENVENILVDITSNIFLSMILYSKKPFTLKQQKKIEYFKIELQKFTVDMKPTVKMITLFTLHLKIKKLSTNSPRDFNSVLDAITNY